MSTIPEFYSKLQNSKSSEIISSLRELKHSKFKSIIQNCSSITQISFQLQDYISQLTFTFSKLWDIDFNSNKQMYPSIIEGFERIIYKLLYNDILSQMNIPNHDLSKFHFITLQHLGINDIDIAKYLTDISFHLNKFTLISQVSSPSDKIKTLCNLCNFINITFNENFDKVKLTKMLSFLFIYSDINDLKTQLLFCSLFKHKTTITSEEDFFLALAIKAINYAIGLNHKNVNMTKEQFNEEIVNPKKKGLFSDFEIKSEYLNKVENVFDIPIEKLMKEYCLVNKNEMTFEMYHKMRNDFKVILKIIESSKDV